MLAVAGPLGVEADGRAQRVNRGRDFIEVRVIPVLAHFPDVAGHVVEAIAVRREAGDGCDALEAIDAGVVGRECALPVVALVFPIGALFFAPDVRHIFQPAARREFPFSFGGQALTGPSCERMHVIPGEAEDGVVHPLFNR